MSFQTIAYSVQGQLTVTTVLSSLWKKTSSVSSLVYKAGENYGYDSATCIHQPLFTLWTTYQSLINTVLQYSADEWEFNKLIHSEVVWSTDSITM